MAGPDSFLDKPLIWLSKYDLISIRQACEPTIILSSSGGGKTANVGKNYAHALLKLAGGLVLCVKSSEAKRWIEYCKACGREGDLIVFSVDSGELFDPIFYEFNRPGRGRGDLESLIDLFSTLLAIGQRESHEGDAFWRISAEALMRNVIVLLSLANEPVSIATINEIVVSLPTTPGQIETPEWQHSSKAAATTNIVKQRKNELSEHQCQDAQAATNYLLIEWPALAEETRTSIQAHWSGMASKFLFSPYRELFCSGKCTFIPEMTTHQNKIVLVDFSVSDYQSTGVLINVMLKLVFQRAWMRRDVAQAPNIAFQWIDEFPFLISPRNKDNLFFQVAREYRIVSVSLAQSIMAIAAQLGEAQIGSQTRALLGNFGTQIYGQQNDDSTRQFAADQIGKVWRYVENFNANQGNDEAAQHRHSGTSVGGGKQLVHIVEPHAFSRLTKPDGLNPWAECLVYANGRHFEATKTEKDPDGLPYLRTAFSRDI